MAELMDPLLPRGRLSAAARAPPAATPLLGACGAATAASDAFASSAVASGTPPAELDGTAHETAQWTINTVEQAPVPDH